jgi:two-component system, chemotaxis family, CheB/CheR fusion protein
MVDDDGSNQTCPEPKPIIVTIGASAGGVSALQQLFEALPEQTGASYVVVVHLDPDRRSELPQILAGRTRIRPKSCKRITSMSFRPTAAFI